MLGLATELLVKFEGFRAEPYLDQAGVPTIGYGSTYYEDGTPVTMSDNMISRERAKRLKEHVLQNMYNQVKHLVEVELNPFQWAAILSFVYNIGVSAFAGSTLLRKLNEDPNDQSIAYEFSRWNKVRVNGVLQVSDGLVTRRKREAEFYFKKKVLKVCPHCCSPLY